MSERRVLRLTGSDRVDFLQNLVTNDVAKLADGLVYAALLTPQGKYLADFFLVPEDDAILIDVSAELSGALAQRLNMYRLRADVALEDTEIAVARGLGPTPPGAFADPRDPALGWRAYDGRSGNDEAWDALRVAHKHLATRRRRPEFCELHVVWPSPTGRCQGDATVHSRVRRPCSGKSTPGHERAHRACRRRRIRGAETRQ